MVVGVEENTASESGFESEEFIVPEFGRVNLTWFDFSRKYRGAIFRLGQDAAKQVAEIVGFSANFELPGIRSCSVDLFKMEGYCLFEIERNTKPTDLAVHYSRERWNLLDATGKAGDVLRPWIKAEYRAKYLPEKLFTLVAEQLKMQPDSVGNFVIRLNFKDRTFGVICEERFADQMPTGSFSPFSLPTEAMLALARKYSRTEEAVEESPRPATPSPFEQVRTASVPEESSVASEKEQTSGAVRTSEATFDRPASPDMAAAPVAAAPAAAAPVSATPPAAEQASDTALSVEQASPSLPTAAATPTEPVASAPTSPEPTASAPTPAPAAAAASFWTATESKTESSTASQTPAQASREETEPLPGSTRSLEKFIQRKADRPVERTEPRREPEPRREQVEGGSAKYATYSKSEVDHMLKQQSENIISALGSKISSQQRVFQEAVERQEKSFAKLSDGFVVQFDQTRIRLENSSKESAETIRTELDTFKKDLSKELEQYRAQINKTVVPVAKFIEDKNAKPVEKAQKEVSQSKGQKSQAAADNRGLQILAMVNIGLLIITLAVLIGVLMPSMTKIESMQSSGDQSNSRPATSAPAEHTSPKPGSSTGSNSTTNSTSSHTSNGTGNLNGQADTSHPVSTSGSN